MFFGGVAFALLLFVTEILVASDSGRSTLKRQSSASESPATYMSSVENLNTIAPGSLGHAAIFSLSSESVKTPTTQLVATSKATATTLWPTNLESPIYINPYPNQPPSTGSFYIQTLSNNQAQIDGENHGIYANSVGGWGGMVILDYGCQVGSQTTQLVNFEQVLYADASQIETLANWYALGFSYTAPNDPLDLVIGTNNSCGVSYTYGSGWEQLVETIAQQVHTVDANISVLGGSDLETQWSSGSAAYAWVQGYAASAGSYQPAMIDYGDMAPGYWTTSQELYVSFGAEPSVAAPELYCSSDIGDWVNGPYSADSYYNFYGVLSYNDQQSSAGCSPNQTNNTSWSQAEYYSFQLRGRYVAYLTDVQYDI